MRLRHRLLLLFAAFAVVSLLAMGGLDYARSLRHVEAVLAVQTEGIATRAASELQDRLDLQNSDIGLLASAGRVPSSRLTPRVSESDERPAWPVGNEAEIS